MNQAAFAAALLDPDLPLPLGVVDPAGRPAQRRFNIYRNSVTQGLGAALETGFPAVLALVGPAFFRAMALRFLREHPPRGRIMMLYGADFADFIAGFAPAQGLGYLADVARFGMNSSCGLLVNSSRGIIYASKEKDFAKVARQEAQKLQLEMKALLDQYLK